ncbi:MAG: helix-turn-helix domain-containing protein [Candidatus Thiodiazotropha sp.]
MVYALEYLAKALKEAREDKKLSQRALSQKAGMPQSQISRIENAAVDLQTSSLIELARALDMDVVLVPRNLVPAVNSVMRMTQSAQDGEEPPRPAYDPDEDDDG